MNKEVSFKVILINRVEASLFTLADVARHGTSATDASTEPPLPR